MFYFYIRMESATEPVSVIDIHGDSRWQCLHEHYVTLCKEREPEVVFVGDSIIQSLGQTEIWEKFFVPLHCLNFGIGGDQTQHVLWRLQNGELDNIEPKVIVLCVGTNNHQHTAQEITEAIVEIIKTIQKKQPQALTIVMGIPPRGKHPNKLRDKLQQVNSSLAERIPQQFEHNAQFLAVDASAFVQSDGTISVADMYDYLHLTKRGYQKFTEQLIEEIESVLKNFMTADSLSQGDIMT